MARKPGDDGCGVTLEAQFKQAEARIESVRRAMGHTLTYSRKVNLAAMIPHKGLASTGYCLADPGKAYVVYQPNAGQAFTLNLAAGGYRYEWFDPARGKVAGQGRVRASSPPPTGMSPASESSSAAEYPGSGLVALPGLVSVMPGSGEMTMAPVSVCHHVSTIGQRLWPMCS